MILGRTGDVDATISNAIASSPNDVTFLRDMINFYASQGRIPMALEVAMTLQKSQPDQWDVPFTIAKYKLISGDHDSAMNDIRRAVQLGGNTALQQIGREQIFQQLSSDPAFQEAVQSGMQTQLGTSVTNALESLGKGGDGFSSQGSRLPKKKN